MELFLHHLQNLAMVGVVFVPLELLRPAWSRERYLRDQWTTDMTFALVNVVFIALGLVSMLAIGMAAGVAWIPGVQAWVSGQPLWAQVVGGVLVADLCWYWSHRLAHRVPLLWRFHAIHHSIEHMDWMAGHRVHPLDQTLTRGSGLMALSFLGLAPEAFAIVGLVFLWHGAVHHANLRFRGGFLRHIIVFSEFHHWHHANHLEAYDRNFAAHFSFLDRLFGTWFESNGDPEKLGIPEPIPVGYVDMLLYPFKPKPEAPQAEAAADAAS
jgi:sterol desaturase/sphingolipid hydroxylase (fatty acid hydroxylase superfamily)